jgi:hypothetical protein
MILREIEPVYMVLEGKGQLSGGSGRKTVATV